MNFTKIEALEYNGQAVIPTKWLADFLSEAENISGSCAYGRVQLGKVTLSVNSDYFALRGITVSDFARHYAEVYPRPSTNLCLFTESGVRKLARTDYLKSLKMLYEKVFGTLIDENPPNEETADVTALTPVEWSAQRVLSTEQLAQFYQCSSDNIKKNFSANKDKFVEGKHYFKVEGDDLNKLRVTESDRQISAVKGGSITLIYDMEDKSGAMKELCDLEKSLNGGSDYVVSG